VVGEDFRFGKDRAGSADTLIAIGGELGFTVSVVAPVRDATGRLVSSTRIRELLGAGDIGEANRLLGHRWFIVGTVIHGEKRGRALGFPTANISLPADCRLREGVYAVTLRRTGGRSWDAVASYGRRPQFGGGDPLLEVFVFDFSADLYGEEVVVQFVDWIRPELTFDSVELLIAAIEEDSRKARALHAGSESGTEHDRALALIS
jgi:riboflavin kinase/FMN adenylyltransferase